MGTNKSAVPSTKLLQTGSRNGHVDHQNQVNYSSRRGPDSDERVPTVPAGPSIQKGPPFSERFSGCLISHPSLWPRVWRPKYIIASRNLNFTASHIDRYKGKKCFLPAHITNLSSSSTDFAKRFFSSTGLLMLSGRSSGNWDIHSHDPEISTWPFNRHSGDVTSGLYELSPAKGNNATHNIVLYAKAIHFLDLDGSKQAETEFAKIIAAFRKVIPDLFPEARVLLLWNVTLGFTTDKIMVYA